MNETRLARNGDDKLLGGVCSGLGQYFGIDTTLVRLLFVVLLFLGVGSMLPIYLILWVAMPLRRSTPQAAPAVASPHTPQASPPALPHPAQDPTGEWKFDPYTGQPVGRQHPVE